MAQLTLELPDLYYRRLEKESSRVGKAIERMILEWIAQLPEIEESFDVTKDPVFQMEGYDSDAPPDLSANLDKYIYGE